MKNAVSILPIITGICFGSIGVFVRTLYNEGFNNMAVLSTRAGMAAFLLLIFIYIYNRRLLKIKAKDLPILVGGGFLGMTMTNICFNVSVNCLSMAFTGVLLSLAPAFVILISTFLFKEKITGKKIICMGLAFAGAILVSGVIESGPGHISLTGVAFGVLSGVFLSMTSIFTKLAIDRGYQGITITFYSILTTAICTVPFTNWGAVVQYAIYSPGQHILYMAFHAIGTAVLPYLCYNISLKYIEAGKAAILAAGEPIAAMAFGLIFYGEALTIFSISGLLITVIALAIMSRKQC